MTKKISQLPAASSAAAANELEINEAGTSKKVTNTQLATFFEAKLLAQANTFAALTSFTLGIDVPTGVNVLFDGAGGHAFWFEKSDNEMVLSINSVEMFKVDSDVPSSTFNGPVIMASGSRLWLDGAVNDSIRDNSGVMTFQATVDGLRLAVGTTDATETNLVVGAANQLVVGATDGFLYVPDIAGTPVGTPTAFTGKVPICFDTANDILYVYNGSWKGVALT